MRFDIAGHQRNIIRNLLKQEIQEKQEEDLDTLEEHMLDEKKQLYRKFGGDLDNL